MQVDQETAEICLAMLNVAAATLALAGASARFLKCGYSAPRRNHDETRSSGAMRATTFCPKPLVTISIRKSTVGNCPGRYVRS
jgi:hypothetical protein